MVRLPARQSWNIHEKQLVGEKELRSHIVRACLCAHAGSTRDC